MQKFTLISLLTIVLLGGCAPQGQVDDLKAELERLKEEGKTPSTEQVVTQPQQPVVQQPQAPIIKYLPTAPVAPKYGPGTSNHLNTPSSGYLDIRTNSANGKLSLRVSPDQNAVAITEIPNGTTGLSYSNRVQMGDYVWYNTQYGSSYGWLRGDYVNAY